MDIIVIYLDVKKKIGIGGRRNIPDGYLIDLSSRQPRLYVVENELASHDPLRHIAIQILEFSLSFESEPRIIRDILFNTLEENSALKTQCLEYVYNYNFRNLDHFLDELVYKSPFAALVIIDDMPDRLENILAKKFKFGVEVLVLARYQSESGEQIYQFKPFLADVQNGNAEDTSEIYQTDLAEIDTVVVPAQEEGFIRTFLGENRWYAIRLHGTMRPQIKYIAAYQVAPISAITHIAPVKSIEPWEDTDKFVLNFSDLAQAITPITLVKKGRVKALQNIRYTSLERLRNAKNLDEIW